MRSELFAPTYVYKWSRCIFFAGQTSFRGLLTYLKGQYYKNNNAIIDDKY